MSPMASWNPVEYIMYCVLVEYNEGNYELSAAGPDTFYCSQTSSTKNNIGPNKIKCILALRHHSSSYLTIKLYQVQITYSYRCLYCIVAWLQNTIIALDP